MDSLASFPGSPTSEQKFGESGIFCHVRNITVN